MSRATAPARQQTIGPPPYLSRYLAPAKLYRLASSLVAVALGGALAIGEPGPLRWPLWAAVAIATLLIHAGGRFLLAAASARRARTRPWRGSESYSDLPVGKFFLVGGILILTGAAFGFLAVIERGWVMFWLGLAAMLGSFAYAHGPALRDKALAEVVSFFLFGPFPVAAAYLAVTGVSPSALTIQSSIPLGLLAAAASLAAGIRDVKGDRQAGSITFATLLGRPAVDYVFLSLISLAFVWLLVLVVRGSLAPICLVPWLTLPQAIGIYATLRHSPGEGNDSVYQMVGKSARLYTYFAALLAFSVALSHMIWQRPI